MSKRRRIFDIEMPEEPETGEASVPAEPVGMRSRPGPMAAAVRENSESLRVRREIEEQIRAENDALAHEHVRLKRLGLVLELVPLDRIDMTMLTRDRRSSADAELGELKASIRAIGLSNPVQLERTSERFELIQGWRRLRAFQELLEETGEERFERIPAAVAEPGRGVEEAYRRMVDENLVRKDISYAEMALLARSYASDEKTAAATVDEAVSCLFESAAAAKRSHIRAFAELLEVLGDHLAHAEAIPRNVGLTLRRRLAEGAPLAELLAALRAVPERSAAEELAILARFVGDVPELGSAKSVAPPLGRGRPRGAKTTFRLPRRAGEARCVAAAGRVELRSEDDFTSYDRKRLEAAAAAFFRELDGD